MYGYNVSIKNETQNNKENVLEKGCFCSQPFPLLAREPCAHDF